MTFSVNVDSDFTTPDFTIAVTKRLGNRPEELQVEDATPMRDHACSGCLTCTARDIAWKTMAVASLLLQFCKSTAFPALACMNERKMHACELLADCKPLFSLSCV